MTVRYGNFKDKSRHHKGNQHSSTFWEDNKRDVDEAMKSITDISYKIDEFEEKSIEMANLIETKFSGLEEVQAKYGEDHYISKKVHKELETTIEFIGHVQDVMESLVSYVNTLEGALLKAQTAYRYTEDDRVRAREYFDMIENCLAIQKSAV